MRALNPTAVIYGVSVSLQPAVSWSPPLWTANRPALWRSAAPRHLRPSGPSMLKRRL